MKRSSALLPTIIVLVAAMLVGFGVLARISDASLLVVVVLGLTVAVVSVLLVWFAVQFDRQMRLLRSQDEKDDQA